MNAEMAAKCVDLYERGMPMRAIARHLDCSYGAVHRVLVNAEVPLRPRGGNTRRAMPRSQVNEYRARLQGLKR